MQGWVLFEAMLVKGNSFFFILGLMKKSIFFPLWTEETEGSRGRKQAEAGLYPHIVSFFISYFSVCRWHWMSFVCYSACGGQMMILCSIAAVILLPKSLCLSSDSNKPNPNQISMTNGKMATVNGAGPGAYHAAGGGRACESCYSELVCACESECVISHGKCEIKWWGQWT